MIGKTVVMLLAFCAIALVGSAQDHPNFAGTWKLNAAKSNPGDFGPSARTDVITQDGSKFTDKVAATTQMGDDAYTLAFTADGSKQTIDPKSPAAAMGNLTLKGIMAAWDGDKLAVDTNASFQEQVDIASHVVYSLSADGKTLTLASHASTSMGDFDTTLVFDKQ